MCAEILWRYPLFSDINKLHRHLIGKVSILVYYHHLGFANMAAG